MSSRTFKLTQPRMQGADVKDWQRLVRDQFRAWKIEYPVELDGVYGPASRDATAALLAAHGINRKAMEHGVTPALRTKVRHRRRTVREQAMFLRRKSFRAKLRKRYAKVELAWPARTVLGDSWRYHPPVHDGMDVITPVDASIFAMVRSKVIDVRSSGWWGKGAQPSPGHPVSDGDGIIQLEVLENVGPFRKGQHIGYGHAEHATVKVGQIVDAGDRIGRAGYANAAHVHLMLNDGTVGTRGIGNLDIGPRYDEVIKKGRRP